MREIEFRAWDIENKEMLDVEYLKWNDITGEFSIRTTMYTDYFSLDELKLMQYIGLKDKNGTKIFDGDIVKAYYFGKEVIGRIDYVNGAFSLVDSEVSDNQLFIFNNLEVIGNIYDNPELLGKESREI